MQPVVGAERTVCYRERSSSYSPAAYAVVGWCSDMHPRWTCIPQLCRFVDRDLYTVPLISALVPAREMARLLRCCSSSRSDVHHSAVAAPAAAGRPAEWWSCRTFWCRPRSW